jgi:hypothetical protein
MPVIALPPRAFDGMSSIGRHLDARKRRRDVDRDVPVVHKAFVFHQPLHLGTHRELQDAVASQRRAASKQKLAAATLLLRAPSSWGSAPL